jgi:hypothetical protein
MILTEAQQSIRKWFRFSVQQLTVFEIARTVAFRGVIYKSASSPKLAPRGKGFKLGLKIVESKNSPQLLL